MQLYRAGYPVPRVHVLERLGSPFGQPMILMDRVPGQLLWTLMTEATGARSEALMRLFCELFVRLHRLDWRSFVDDPSFFAAGDPYARVERGTEVGRLLIG